MKRKNISRILCLLCGIAAITLMAHNYFKADTVERSDLVDLYLNITVYNKDGEKVYLNSNDDISLISTDGNADFNIDNGSVSAIVPLYEYDNEKTKHTEKRILVDDSIHSVTINEGSAYINSESWMFNAKKDGKELAVEMSDFSLEIEGYDGCVVEWKLTKELEQTFVEGDNETALIVTSGDLYKKQEYEMVYGDASIIRYTAPCNHRGADAYEDEDGYYIQFNMDEDNAFSIAKGTVIAVDDVDKSVAVQYNEGIFIVYGNVSPAVKVNDELRRGDLIGYVNNKSLTLRTCDNGRWVTSEWLYDDFERPLEGPNCPRIYQAGQDWSSREYGYNTIGGGGCGPTSIAMAASGILGRVYTPEDIVDIIEAYNAPGIWWYSKGEGSTYLIFPRVCSVLGLETEHLYNVSESTIRNKLEDGKMVIVSISAGRYYHGDGHFILIRGLDSNGNFLINDSSNAFDLNTGYSYDDIRPIKSARTIYKP